MLTNGGGSPCRLQGYPGVSFLTPDGVQVGGPADRAEGEAAPVTLEPGGQAHVLLNQANAYNFGVECGEPLATTTLRFIPPDSTDDVRIPFETRVCTNLNGGQVGPLRAGAE